MICCASSKVETRFFLLLPDLGKQIGLERRDFWRPLAITGGPCTNDFGQVELLGVVASVASRVVIFLLAL